MRAYIFSKKFTIYLLVGVFSAAVDLGVFQWLICLGYSVNVALFSSFISGLCVNYVGHASFTFKVKFSWVSFVKYLFVVVLNYFLAFSVVWVCILVWDSPFFGKLASLPVVALSGYHIGKRWIFAADVRLS
jgi:putative flippase GtrA